VSHELQLTTGIRGEAQSSLDFATLGVTIFRKTNAK